MKIHKPFLKWVGGKTQIINHIIEKIPKEMNNYHEVFVGGGSVLLAFLTLVKENQINVKEIYAYDLNKYLIEVYQNIQQNKEKLFNSLDKKTRYDIRKSEKSDLEFVIVNKRSDFLDYVKLKSKNTSSLR